MYDEKLDLDILAPYFTKDELKCPTDGSFKMASGFAQHLTNLRRGVGLPFKVNSCCRSRAYNASLKDRGYEASPNSFHLIENPQYGTDTCAIDIHVPDGVFIHKVLKVALPLGWSAGIAKTFIHLDRRIDYTDLSAVIYTYN